MAYRLYIGNKNYSSWSLRPWLLMRALDIPFEEYLVPFVARLDELWREGLDRFGGPFLAGSAMTAVDAFFAPVAFRVQTFGLALTETATNYGRHLLGHEHMRNWYAAAIAETWREAAHEQALTAVGRITSDERAT